MMLACKYSSSLPGSLLTSTLVKIGSFSTHSKLPVVGCLYLPQSLWGVMTAHTCTCVWLQQKLFLERTDSQFSVRSSSILTIVELRWFQTSHCKTTVWAQMVIQYEIWCGIIWSYTIDAVGLHPICFSAEIVFNCAACRVYFSIRWTAFMTMICAFSSVAWLHWHKTMWFPHCSGMVLLEVLRALWLSID